MNQRHTGGVLASNYSGDPIGEDGGGAAFAPQVRVRCGLYQVDLPVAGRTVGEIKQRLRAYWSVCYWCEAWINGHPALLRQVLRGGDRLIFRRRVGFKGGDAASPEVAEAEALFAAYPELREIAGRIKAMGWDRDRSIDMAVAILARFALRRFGTPSEADRRTLAEVARLLVCPPEVDTAEVARIHGVSKDTVLKWRAAGVIPYRDVAPPGSSRPNFRYPLAAVLALRNDYRTEQPITPMPEEPARRRVKGQRKYKHLRLDDDI